ncbi:MAG: hypothetical protein DBX91_06100 [Subdoligranulum variabile]|nr:MAG: hypothetical protein DBX91_06100 [Subdoligranulum variabile]
MHPLHSLPFSCSFDVDATPQLIHEPIGHMKYKILLVTSGHATATVMNHTYALSRGSLLFIGRLESHSIQIQHPPYTRYVVTLSMDTLLNSVRDNHLLAIFLHHPASFQHLVQLDETTLSNILPYFQHLLHECREQAPYYEETCTSWFHLFLIELYRLFPQAFPKWSNCITRTAVVAAQQYMAQQFHRQITLNEVAEHVFVSRHTLSLAFRDAVGMTFKDYLILLRLTEAKRLLLTTDLPVSKIGEAVGYTNVNNFIETFRKHLHTTPLQYRLHQRSSYLEV